MISPHVRVTVDLSRVRRNAADVAARVGVPVWATIKADAYGLGAARIAQALADVPGVAGFCVFSLDEARSIDLWILARKPIIALGPPATLDPQPWLDARVRPAVTTVEQATRLAPARPILCVDTGMQRFACPPEQVAAVLDAGPITEAFTHATRPEHADRLREFTAGRQLTLHAAATALLDDPAARLDAVRPGLAIYQGAARVTARLAEVRRSTGPVGYTGWPSETGQHGVILAGYSHELRPGPVRVNGRPRRVAEVGMQSAFVTCDAPDRAGDEVVLLGDDLTEAEVARAWNVTPHHALLALVSMGGKAYEP